MTETALTIPEEISIAQKLHQEILQCLGQACLNEFVLERSWMYIGELLTKCKANEHWRELGFESWEKYMFELKTKFKRGRTQLWSYQTIAETLLPTIDGETLEEIGVSKAGEIKKHVNKALKAGKSQEIPSEILEVAKKPETTAKELRAVLGQFANSAENENNGTWRDLDGFFATKEEWDEYKNCVFMTARLLGIKNHIPEHLARKEVFMAWIREFWGTHAAEVFGPNAQ